MRFLLLVKASGHSEAGLKPSATIEEAMNAFRERLAGAGVLVASDELETSASGVRISYPKAGEGPVVTVGPFPARERGMVAGYTVIDVGTQEEAIEWAMRMPDPNGYGEGNIELRQIKTKTGGY
ncbi:YciI family protein [Cohnella suwonensis]|uniref:YciI family protein n=1 Tax=Cohnella suwonensis TaxID=696072 RepID=A0ABW0LZ72_9BACL